MWFQALKLQRLELTSSSAISAFATSGSSAPRLRLPELGLLGDALGFSEPFSRPTRPLSSPSATEWGMAAS